LESRVEDRPITLARVLRDTTFDIDPAQAASALSQQDYALEDLLISVAASPLVGGHLLPACPEDAVDAMGGALFRKAVLWRQLLRAIESATQADQHRVVAMAGLAVHELKPPRDPDRVADAITLGLSAQVGSARLSSRLGGSPFSAVLGRLYGGRLAQAERYFFGRSGLEELEQVAQTWQLPPHTARLVLAEPGSAEALRQESLAVKLDQLHERDGAWQTIVQVGTLLGRPNPALAPTPAPVDASGLAVLSSLLSAGKDAGDSVTDEQNQVRAALQLAGDPRFIWAFAESSLHAAKRFQTPMSIIAISASGESKGPEALRAQIACFQAIRDLIRSSDAIGLLDNVHFLVVLPGTDTHGARVLADRMAHRLRQAAQDSADIYSRTPHYVYCTSLYQETATRPTVEQLVQTALRGLEQLRRSPGFKRAGWNQTGVSMFKR
jgi:hypothetical protein